jgi:mevalonate kinase
MSQSHHQVVVSAPGKLFVLGEHAVIYNGTCIVTAVDSRLRMTLTQSPSLHAPQLTITAPDVDLQAWRCGLQTLIEKSEFSGPSSFIESCVALCQHYFPEKFGDFDLTIETSSDFGATLGLGSSSATVAACLFGLAVLLDIDLDPFDLFELGVQAIQQVQTLGSGADLAAAIYGGTLYYINDPADRDVIPFDLNELPLLVVYSGTKAKTVSYVKEVAKLKDRWTDAISQIIETMLLLVENGRTRLDNQNWPDFGQLMNIQHGLLHALDVDTPALSNIVFAARAAGAYGAKLSGAGGGDCAIVLVDPAQKDAIAAKLRAAGHNVLDINVNADGVRLET